MTLDRLDIAIIRELTQSQEMLPARIGLKPSYRNMAKRLRVSTGTVVNRIRLMQSTGFLLGSTVYPNPALLGLNGGAYAIEIESTNEKTLFIENLRSEDFVLFIHNFFGSLAGIFFVYESEADLQRKLLRFQTFSGSKQGMFTHVSFPPIADIPTESEWMLIRELTKGDFQSYADLSIKLKTSQRTLKRAMAGIKRGRALLSMAKLNFRAIKNAIPVDLIVAFSRPDAKVEAEEKVLSIIGDYLHFAGIGREYTVYNLFLPSVPLIKELVESVKNIDGIRVTRAELVNEHIDLTENFTRSILKSLGGQGSKSSKKV